MAAVKNVQVVGSTFPNESTIVRVKYDFSKDGGVAGDLDLLVAEDDIVIKHVHMKVIAAVTSGGAATLSAGIAADKDALIDSVAIAGLGAGAFAKTPLVEGAPNTNALPMKLAAGEKITQTIEVAALTAGIVEYCFEITRF